MAGFIDGNFLPPRVGPDRLVTYGQAAQSSTKHQKQKLSFL
jgi:hypothetical protein